MSQNRPCEALLLDFYGTLVEEDTDVIASIVARIVEASPHSPNQNDVSASWNRRFSALCSASYGSRFRTQRDLEQESLRQLLDEYEADLDPMEASAELFAYWVSPRPLPGATEFLAANRLPICIVSNIDSRDLDAALRHLGWEFPHVVTSQDCRAYKPRTEPFETALSLLGCSYGNALHVGDSVGSDLIGATAAGIATAWINPRGRPLPDGASVEPRYTLANIGELIGLVR